MGGFAELMQQMGNRTETKIQIPEVPCQSSSEEVTLDSYKERLWGQSPFDLCCNLFH